MMLESDHLDSDQIAAYAECRLPSADRAQVEVHLADCRQCRQEAIAARRLLLGERRHRRTVVGVPILALAATIAGLYFIGAPPQDRTPDNQLRPGGVREGLATIPAWRPETDRPGGRDSLQFVWGADGAGALYRLTVTDEAGATLWNGATSDTVALLPDSVRLVPGARYHWFVDALLADGQRATTGLREFRVAP
jgi:anti-sigma factor RsiW